MIDTELISALGLGMPRWGDFGLGIDRLMMLYTYHNPKNEVLLFH